MTQLLNYLLSYVLIYGYPTVGIIVFVGALGLPLPASSLLVAAGSFTVDGTLNIPVLIVLSTLTALCGDLGGYYIGKRLGYIKSSRLSSHFAISRSLKSFFVSHGVWSIFITRWLITPLAVPINVLAGVQRYSVIKFSLIVVIGELLWSSLYVCLGYWFGANWQSLIDYINKAPQILAVAAIGIGFLFMAIKHKHQSKK